MNEKTTIQVTTVARDKLMSRKTHDRQALAEVLDIALKTLEDLERVVAAMTDE